MTDTLAITAKNTAPYLAGGTQLALGSTEYVAVEVLVDFLLRKLLRAPHRGVTDLAIIHTLTIPIIGALTAAVGRAGPLDYGTGSIFDQLKDGAAGIPAVFVAQLMYGSRHGFQIPRGFEFRDILVSALSKTVTKPLLSLVWPYLPKKYVQDSLRAVNKLFRAELQNSNIAPK